MLSSNLVKTQTERDELGWGGLDSGPVWTGPCKRWRSCRSNTIDCQERPSRNSCSWTPSRLTLKKQTLKVKSATLVISGQVWETIFTIQPLLFSAKCIIVTNEYKKKVAYMAYFSYFSYQSFILLSSQIKSVWLCIKRLCCILQKYSVPSISHTLSIQNPDVNWCDT